MKNKKIVIRYYIFTILCFCTIFFSSFKVFATETGGNADQSDGGESTQKVIGGPSWEKTGWLVYIIDEAGNQLTDTKVFYSSSAQTSAQTSAGNGGVLLNHH